MKRYGQFCALARALDKVGERWTLLIVRELLLASAGYASLARALPGVPTNLLADRLRQLEADGIVRRVVPPSGARGVRYELTELGRGLEPALLALIRWGAEWMGTGAEGDHFDPRWLVLALRALLADPHHTAPRAELELRFGDQVLAVSVGPEGREVRVGRATAPVATVSGEGAGLLAVASGMASLQEAGGVRVTGDRVAASRLLAPPR
ncbi:MAG TPA: helix-turn-helix domain-containing protein [Acidimicrobiales bacterium]|nr:helix-turn-helix domain-containing protein [Acidimicrobiales bacterium]